MSLVRITPPMTLPITVAEAKANGKIDSDIEDGLIEAYIGAALAHAERWCGVAFEEQVWELVIDTFPTAEIQLPLGPVVSVTSVKYDDGDGIEQTVDADDYVVDVPGGWVVPVTGFTWPTTLTSVNSVRVRFVVGAGSDEDIRQAIMLIVEDWNANRSDSSEATLTTIPRGATALLNLHRRMFV